MKNRTQQTTKYPGVYVDDKGNFFINQNLALIGLQENEYEKRKKRR